MDDDFRKAALDYHRLPQPGKLAIEPTKRMATQRDLALAYSPGVAAACEAIVADPDAARDYTARGNLVGVISNGTAVLGLGNIGALAGKPVMEGKAVLFKKFAGIDVFDIEVDADGPGALLRRGGGAGADLRRDQPGGHQGAGMLRHRGGAARAHEHPGVPRRPARHRDHRGRRGAQRAACCRARRCPTCRLVTSGAGAAALACVDLLVSMGLRPENVTLTDIKGVVRTDRAGMLPNMARYARDTNARTLRGRAAGRRCVPRPVGAARAEAGMAAAAGAEAADPGAGQSGSGDPAGAGRRRAARRDRRHRAQRLSQSGQQRPVLSVHLPRRAGRLRHHHQRGDEDRRRRGDRRRSRASRPARWWPRPMAVRRRCSVPTTSFRSRSIRA